MNDGTTESRDPVVLSRPWMSERWIIENSIIGGTSNGASSWAPLASSKSTSIPCAGAVYWLVLMLCTDGGPWFFKNEPFWYWCCVLLGAYAVCWLMLMLCTDGSPWPFKNIPFWYWCCVLVGAYAVCLVPMLCTGGTHQYQWARSITTNKDAESIPEGDVKKKIMGCHQCTAWAPTSTQHEYQQAHSISTNKYTASTPKGDVLKNHGMPPVHSISTTQHTA